MTFSLRIKRKTNNKIKLPRFKNKKQVVKVGLPLGKAASNVIEYAIYNHFGVPSKNIPERPFLKLAINKNKNAYRKMMKSAASKILKGKLSTHASLQLLGIKAQGDIQRQITSLRTPPNKPATIKRKGSSNPLIDTGTMRGSITWVVDD